MFQVTYVPPRHYTGVSVKLCFKARGAEGLYRVVKDRELCITIKVLPCVWTVQESENLAHIQKSTAYSELYMVYVICNGAL